MGRSSADQILNLIPAFGHLIRSELSNQKFEKLPLSQFRVLAILDKKSLKPSELADWMGISLPVTTRLIQNLENKKLVKRQFCSADRRQVFISVSGLGRKRLAGAKKTAVSALYHRMEPLSEVECVELQKGLKVMKKILRFSKYNKVAAL